MISLNSCPFGRTLYVKGDIYVGVKWYWYLFVDAVGDRLSYCRLYACLSPPRIACNWDIVTQRLLTPAKRTQVFGRTACIFQMRFSSCLYFVWYTTKTAILQTLRYTEQSTVNLKYKTLSLEFTRHSEAHLPGQSVPVNYESNRLQEIRQYCPFSFAGSVPYRKVFQKILCILTSLICLYQ